KRGDPQPPLRQTPQAPQVRIAQRGDAIEIALGAPRLAAGGGKLPVLEIEVLRATGAGDFRKLAKSTRRAVAPGETLVEKEPLPPAGTVVRVAGRAWLKGRPSPQTAATTLTVQAAPEPPHALRAALSATGVALEWTAPDHMPTPPPPSPTPAKS